MKKIKSILLLLIILPCLFVFTACGNKSDNNNKDTLTYNVVFEVDGNVYDTKKVENGGKVPKPENPSKELYIFAGWYNGKTEWDFDNDVVSGNLTLTARFNKFDNIDKDYIKINNFEVKKDENDEEYYLRKVSNKKTRYNFNDDIFVGEKLKWFVSFDVSGNNEIKSKMAELEIGDNIFYLIVQNDKNDIKQYVLHVYRRQLFEVIFNTNGGGTVEPQTVEEDSLVKTPTEKLSKEGYEFVGWDYNLELPVREDLIISAKYNPIKYTATFKVEGREFATKTFTVEDSKVPNTPSVPAKTGYTAKWEDYKIKAEDITINAVYTPIVYTATFKVEGREFATKTFTVEDSKVPNTPSIPTKTGYTGKWEDYEIKTEDITINAIYTPIVYTATFKVEGREFATKTFTVEDSKVPNTPSVPTKTGYTAKWENYEIKAEDITINAVYTPIVYTATFKADGKVVKTVNFTVEDKSLTEIPTIPIKTGYIEKWENYEIKAEDITINAIYTPIVYTATFKVDAKVVKTINFTVEDKSLTEMPTVPEKAGYTAKWESYEIKAENIIINAIYTPINYSIIFKNYDGTILSEKKDYHYGDSVIVPSPLPSKPADNICFYNFIGWDSEVVAVTEDKIYIAQYEEKYITYTITYHNTYDAVNPNKTTYDYATPTFNISNISISDIEFLGWYSDENLTIPAKTTIEKGGYGNLDFYAKWKLTYYSITYILPIEVKHSNPLTYTKLTPETVLSDVEIDGYKFLGWYTSNSFNESKRITTIAGNKIGNLTIYGKYENLTGLTFEENNDGFYVSSYSGNSETVVIPNYYNGKKVSAIGDKAFYDCNTIKNVTIGNNVTSIGGEAFKGCSSLTNVYYTGTIEDWCNITFSDYYSNPMRYASHFYIKNSNGEYEELTAIEIPNTVTKINDYAFYRFYNVTKVTIPNSVTSIEDYSFYNCSSLTSVYYTGTIENWCNITFSDYYSNPMCYASHFYIKNSNGEYEELTEIEIPNTVTEIKDYTFNGFKNVTKVTIPNSVTSIGGGAFRGCSSLTSITIPNSVTSIGRSAFSGCSSLTSITIPDSVTSIGEDAFYNCSSLKYNIYDNAKYLGNNENPYLVLVDTINTDITTFTINNNTKIIYSSAFYNCSRLTSITIPNSVTSIGDDAFYNCSRLTSITIPNSVTSIGSSAFSCCSSLTSVTIGNSVTSIGDEAFYNCSRLTSITIPNSVTSIGSAAFSGCSRLTSITIPNSVTSIGSSAFSCCSSLTSVTIGNSVTSIGYSAFEDCSSLTSITIGNSVTSIGNRAFYNCSSLTSITIGNSVTSIGSAFYDSYRLVEVYNLSSLNIEKGSSDYSYIGYYAKDIYTSLDQHSKLKTSNGVVYYINGTEKIAVAPEDMNATSIVIDNDCTEINQYAFYGCSGLTSITIPNSVKSIGRGAFYNCSRLTSITIPNSVTNIGEYAFEYCSSLTSITIPNSVTSIGRGAFYNCRSLTSITIPNSVTSIGEYAFEYCSSLSKVYYKGNASEWNRISNRYYNDCLENATKYYYSETKPTGSGNYWHYDSDGNVKEW